MLNQREANTQESKMKLLFATTGAGKSFLASKHPERFLDGDKMVSWPPRDSWWVDPSPNEIKQVNAHISTFLQKLEDPDERIIVYNPRSEALKEHGDALRRAAVADKLYLWVLTPTQLRSNLDARLRMYSSPDWDETQFKQPTDFELAYTHQRQLERALTYVPKISDPLTM
jgi:hypothetical protein